MRTFWRIILLTVLVAGVGLGGWQAWRVYGAPRDIVMFRTVPAGRGDLAAIISATGTIEPEEVIDMGAQVAAQIKHFGADPRDPNKAIDYGTPVHPGTLLAQLDDSLFKARVEQARAAVDEAQAGITQADANVARAEADVEQYKAKVNQAERDWARAQQLFASSSIAQADVDLARAAAETARANVRVAEAAITQARASRLQADKSRGKAEATLREAEVNLGYTQIRSPVEGVIVDRRVNVGQTVVAGLNAPSLFLIAKDLKRLQVWASVNEADIGSIHPGQAVHFTVDAFPKETFVGQVGQIRLNATMTQNVVTYTVVVNTDNAGGKLLPYMTANLRFEIDHRSDALLVPNAALRWKPRPPQIAPEYRTDRKPAEKDAPDRAVLWVVEDEFVRPVPVRIGLSDGVQTEVVEGELRPGDPIVVGTRRAGPSSDDAGTPFAPRMFGGKKS